MSFALKAFALFRGFISNAPDMRMLKVLWLSFVLSAICFAATPPSETDDAARIIEAALQPSPLENNLHHLTDEIGGRVPGTPAMQHAVEWGVKALTVAGADSVHTEGFTIPSSWSEGATEMTVTAFYEVGDPKVGGLLPTVFHAHAVSVAWATALLLTSRRPGTFPASWCWCIRLSSKHGTISSPSIRTRRP